MKLTKKPIIAGMSVILMQAVSYGATVLLGPTTITSTANAGAVIGTSSELAAGTTSVVIAYTISNDGDGATAERWGTVSFNGTGLGQFDFFGATDFAALTRTTNTVGPGGGNHEGFSVEGTVGAAVNSSTATSFPVTITLTGLGATWATSDNTTITYAVDGGTVVTTGIDFDTAPVFRLHTQNTAHTVTDFTVTAIPEPTSTALLGLGGLTLILRRRK